MRQNLIFVFTSFILFFSVVMYSQPTGSSVPVVKLQGQALIDSILTELPKQKEDTIKAMMLTRLSNEYVEIDLDKGLKYAQEGLELANELNWKKGVARLNNVLGVIYIEKSEYPAALSSLFKALKTAQQEGWSNRIGAVSYYIAVSYRRTGNYAEAIKYYFMYLKVQEKSGSKIRLAKAYDNISAFYSDNGDYSKALEYSFKALHLFEELNDTAEMAFCYGNIAVSYDGEKKYEEALQYYFSALRVFKTQKRKGNIATTIGNIGDVYFGQGNYALAIEYQKKSLEMCRELGDRFGEAINLVCLGNCFLALDTATVVYSRQLNDIEPVNTTFRPVKGVPIEKAALRQKAIYYSKQAAAISEEINATDLIRSSYMNLAEAYKLSGNYKKAFESYKICSVIDDSIFSKDNEKKIVQQQMQYEYGKREDSIKLVNAGKEKEAALRYVRQRNYTYTGLGGVLALVLFSFFMFRNNKLLGKEKKRSDDLLLNILPAEVASELKDKGSAAARHFDNVTVLFTDFVNFTHAAETMKPQALIDEMHACFTKFDEITSKYKIEKIKTIGDAYLAAAGLPMPDPDHAAHVIQAAKEITDFMTTRYNRLGDKTFQVRVGIHSGSVVAGIVGVKKFAYDIWGDTVNTAARMEQNSEAGKINISQTTYELVKDTFACEYRGEVAAKGKGMMKMYFVE